MIGGHVPLVIGHAGVVLGKYVVDVIGPIVVERVPDRETR